MGISRGVWLLLSESICSLSSSVARSAFVSSVGMLPMQMQTQTQCMGAARRAWPNLPSSGPAFGGPLKSNVRPHKTHLPGTHRNTTGPFLPCHSYSLWCSPSSCAPSCPERRRSSGGEPLQIPRHSESWPFSQRLVFIVCFKQSRSS